MHGKGALIGSLSNDNDDGNMNGKNDNSLRLAKQQLYTYITLFCSFLCRRWLQDYDLKPPNFTFCREREHNATTSFFFFWILIQSFRIELKKNLPTSDELNEME